MQKEVDVERTAPDLRASVPPPGTTRQSVTMAFRCCVCLLILAVAGQAAAAPAAHGASQQRFDSSVLQKPKVAKLVQLQT